MTRQNSANGICIDQCFFTQVTTLTIAVNTTSSVVYSVSQELPSGTFSHCYPMSSLLPAAYSDLEHISDLTLSISGEYMYTQIQEIYTLSFLQSGLDWILVEDVNHDEMAGPGDLLRLRGNLTQHDLASFSETNIQLSLPLASSLEYVFIIWNWFCFLMKSNFTRYSVLFHISK